MRPLTPAIALAATLPTAAWACGQSTHVWVSLAAAPLVPPSELADLVQDPELYDALVSGTMFPDGGYAIGDGYAEIAHWPPFQQAYRAWIAEQFAGALDSLEARRHIAFFLGMSSHGLSDELFDSQLYERSRQEDPGHDEAVTNFDTATDVTFIAEVGPPREPTSWVPADVLSALYATAVGHTVTPETLLEGQLRLHAALQFVAWAADTDERIETMTAEFPWGAAHMSDPNEAGSPPHQTEAIVGYWQEQWARLHGADGAWGQAVVQAAPADGSWGHATAADRVEGRLHLAFNRGIDSASLGAVRVLDAGGDEVGIERRLFYGSGTHTLVLTPTADWTPGVAYTLSVGTDLVDEFGQNNAVGWTSTFHAGPAPEPPAPEPEPGGCEVAGASRAGPAAGGLGLLGLGPWLRRRRRC